MKPIKTGDRVLVKVDHYKYRYLTIRVNKGSGHIMTRRGRVTYDHTRDYGSYKLDEYVLI